MTNVPDPIAPPLSERVRTALFWRSGSQILAQIVMWGSTIVVVRLLDPHDYGLFAMTQVVLALFNFLNGYSFASALVQADSINDRRIAQVFGLLILLNVGLAIVQFFAAPIAAAYFRQPMIADLLRVQSLLYLATPFIALPSAILARGLEFKMQAASNMAGALAGAVTAFACAWWGLGVWTLVAAPLALFYVRAIGLTYAARTFIWPSFNFTGARHMFTFGGALVLCQLFWIVQSQSDIFFAGRHFSPHDLGLYAEALFVTLIFTGKFIPPLNEVAFPAYANLAKEGGHVGDAFITSARLTMFVALPLYFGMAVIAEPLVTTLFGVKWTGMAPIVSGLAIAMPFFALQILCSPATNALGLPQVYIKSSIAGAIIMPVAFLVGLRWGVTGLVHAWQVASPLLLIVTLMLTLPVIGADWRKLAAGLVPTVVAAGTMALIVYVVSLYTRALPPPITVVLLGAIGAACYIGLLWCFARPILDQIIGMIIHKRPLIAQTDSRDQAL